MGMWREGRQKEEVEAAQQNFAVGGRTAAVQGEGRRSVNHMGLLRVKGARVHVTEPHHVVSHCVLCSHRHAQSSVMLIKCLTRAFRADLSLNRFSVVKKQKQNKTKQ